MYHNDNYNSKRGGTRPADQQPYQPALDDRQGNVYPDGVNLPARADSNHGSQLATEQKPKVGLPKFDVSSIRLINSGAVRAEATIKIGPMEVKKCLLFEPSGKDPFVTGPSEKYQKRDQTTGYSRLVTWPAEWDQAICSAFQAAVNADDQTTRRGY